MSGILHKGQKVNAELSGTQAEVLDYIGGGGQGEVYRARLNGKEVALKWYLPQYLAYDDKVKERLQKAIRAKAPSNRFLWPQELASAEGIENFGYIMPLRESSFKSLLDLMKGRTNPTFRSITTAGYELAHSIAQLHYRGLCYRDINFGNVFFDPVSGDIRICDNDNVDVNGVPGIIAGSPDFMAPEIVRGTATPSIQTDAFSLAILLFYMLFRNHPLQGQKILDIHIWDAAARRKLFGTEPVFIFDPNDKSNSAVSESDDPLREAGANALRYWPIYPKFLRDLFIKAFTKGCLDPQHGRILEPEWKSAMLQLRDSIVYCPNCGKQNFYDADILQTNGGRLGLCWKDRAQLVTPPRMRIMNHVIMLNCDTQLFAHHTDSGRPDDFSTMTAEVVSHPTIPNVYGLKNLTVERWVAITEDGSLKDIDPGRSITLANGTTIYFGTAQGTIRI